MNKSELVEALAVGNGLTYKKSEEIVNIIFDSMADALTSGGRIEIRGLAALWLRITRLIWGEIRRPVKLFKSVRRNCHSSRSARN